MTFDEKEAAIESIETLARLMDSRFNIPGIPFPLGLDTIIGLVPGIGDTVGLGISGYIIAQSKRLGVSNPVILKMIINVFVDWFIGIVPGLGDIFDWGWRANDRNAKLLRDYYETHLRQASEPDMIDVTPPKQ